MSAPPVPRPGLTKKPRPTSRRTCRPRIGPQPRRVWLEIPRGRHKPKQLAGDKGYSVQSLRDWLAEQNIEPVIPHKANELARHDPATCFDSIAYAGRSVAEQCVGWLKEFRRIGTRFEKLAVNFHGMLQLAMIQRYFRLLF